MTNGYFKIRRNRNMDYQLIATTTFGIEAVTAKELRQLGYEDLKLENGKEIGRASCRERV